MMKKREGCGGSLRGVQVTVRLVEEGARRRLDGRRQVARRRRNQVVQRDVQPRKRLDAIARSLGRGVEKRRSVRAGRARARARCSSSSRKRTAKSFSVARGSAAEAEAAAGAAAAGAERGARALEAANAAALEPSVAAARADSETLPWVKPCNLNVELNHQT